MKRSILFTLCLAMFAAACSGNDGEIKVAAASSPLTEKGSDALFSIDVVDASSDGYAIDKIRVHVTPPDGKPDTDVVCTLDDVNKNQKVDKGDKLSCAEGADNKLDATLAGLDIDVEMFATVDGKEKRVGDGTWTAAK